MRQHYIEYRMNAFGDAIIEIQNETILLCLALFKPQKK